VIGMMRRRLLLLASQVGQLPCCARCWRVGVRLQVAARQSMNQR
jgi:hypothetical protein